MVTLLTSRHSTLKPAAFLVCPEVFGHLLEYLLNILLHFAIILNNKGEKNNTSATTVADVNNQFGFSCIHVLLNLSLSSVYL